jgi:hypothetical protein
LSRFDHIKRSFGFSKVCKIKKTGSKTGLLQDDFFADSDQYESAEMTSPPLMEQSFCQTPGLSKEGLVIMKKLPFLLTPVGRPDAS